ncbi:MAG: HNH endonuclease [Mesorhizobium sp.]|uniref:HNH endonuclease signature motif containing protein n=1 Tax=Mesorhizobium sp. TaxID=1871066 RepID=UPI000FE85202|nr:HNH endonuclease signature motif containing protein [Mesorhizobium sp.]RWA81490.1 MAG: HNH endonuclease [Mesorhizobium sp.]
MDEINEADAVLDSELQRYLKECFLYEPDTGRFWWRHRPLSHFETSGMAASWNTRWAGTEAFVSRVGKNKAYLAGRVTIDGEYVKMLAHVAAWIYVYGVRPLSQIDHKNTIKSDNRIDNLRQATQTENNWNQTKRKASPYPKGVYKPRDKKRFVAQAVLGGKNTFLGYFDTPDEAHAAWLKAVTPERGDFLRVA